MPSMVLRDTDNIDVLAARLRGRKFPLTVSWSQGASRAAAQNRLAQRWFSDISRQLGDRNHNEVRAECKMMFGVPILRAENEAFRQSYDATLRPLAYAEKLAAIQAFDLPVTRLMTLKQMARFMDDMQRHWITQRVRLTDPDALKYEEEFA